MSFLNDEQREGIHEEYHTEYAKEHPEATKCDKCGADLARFRPREVQILYEGKKVKQITISYRAGCRLYYDSNGMTDFWCSGLPALRPIQENVYQIEMYNKNQVLNVELLVKGSEREGVGYPLAHIARVEWK